MNHLSNEDMDILQERLGLMRKRALEEIEAVRAEIASTQAARTREVGADSDDIEIARLEQIRRSEMELDRGVLRKIEEAERRITEGVYGLCADCGEPIARERLLAMPVANRCAVCENKQETQSVRS